MIFKWIFTGLAILWFYRLLNDMLQPSAPKTPQGPNITPAPPPPKKWDDDDGDYIDYEELPKL